MSEFGITGDAISSESTVLFAYNARQNLDAKAYLRHFFAD